MSSPYIISLSGSFVIASMSSTNVALMNKKNGSIRIYSYCGRKESSFQVKGMDRSTNFKDFVTVSTKHLGLVEPSDDKVSTVL